MSLLFVDSGCDISPNQIKMLGIECIYLPYTINNDTLALSEDFDYDKFYSKLRKGVVLTKKLLSKQEYMDIFSPVLKSDDVIYIHSSSEILDYSVLSEVKKTLLKKYPDRRFELIDSANISIGQGILSYLLAKRYRSGDTIDEIVINASKLNNEIAMYALVDSLESLNNNGLIDSSKVIGSALNIKYIIAVDIDGRIQIVDKLSGRKKAINKLVEIVRENGENIVDYPIAIAHSGTSSDSEFLEEKLKEYFGQDIELFQQCLSPSTTALFGNNALCVAFHIHNKIH